MLYPPVLFWLSLGRLQPWGCPGTALCPGHGAAWDAPCQVAELSKKGKVGGESSVESQKRKGAAGRPTGWGVSVVAL